MGLTERLVWPVTVSTGTAEARRQEVAGEITPLASQGSD